MVEEARDAYTWRFEYSDEVFSRPAVERLAGHLGELMRTGLESPATRIRSLPLMRPSEMADLASWSRGSRRPAPLGPLTGLESHFRHRPDAPAVVHGANRLTYAELDARSAAIARRLRRYRSPRGELVAIVLPRSVELVEAIVGVTRAGMAYLPIDPATPSERLHHIVLESASCALLAGAGTPALPELSVPVLDVACVFDDGGAPLEPVERDPRELAYVIYTSGSTGGPKGVEVTNAGLANYVQWDVEAYRLGPEDRCSLLASPGFDASAWEMWPALAAGASLWVGPDEMRTDVHSLFDWMRTCSITVGFVPTPLANQALATDEEPPLRATLTGGDVLRQWPSQPQPAIVNHYGPTETTIVVTAVDLSKPDVSRQGLPPIGRPIANIDAFILDANLMMVPAGVPGEIFISGVGLARGYRGRADLTAAAFLPHPFDPGERIYRTGDIGRWRDDGHIEFLRRRDRQVKVRGNRVELGEVEGVLDGIPRIRESAVIPVENKAETSLVAYVVTDGAPEPTREEVVAALRRRLPSYMVPSRVLSVPSLPKTSSDKLDRRHLPGGRPLTDRNDRPDPTTDPDPLDLHVLAIFQSVLGTDRVGPDDDFFDHGGTSVMVLELVDAMASGLQVHLPVREVFVRRTPRAVAETVRTKAGSSDVGAKDR
jgi:amino acid adenylation domain-containing protein